MTASFDELRNKIAAYHPAADLAPVEKAYRFSREAHEGQRRASGEEFFSHCFTVAQILTELKMDLPTIAAALLHDVLEDTAKTADELNKTFGQEITAMVEGVTKISSYHFKDAEAAQAENWRKMLLAVTRDVRVIIIKLADRLHNMRTIRYLDGQQQIKVAAESLHLYAPFAQRLGIYRWKSELEDLAFGVLLPEDYRALRDLWEHRRESDEKNIERWRTDIIGALQESGIPFRLSARPKSLYGIYKKMQRRHLAFADIEDLIGLRLITDTVENCYALLDCVNRSFAPVPGTFTDYISFPKNNMYQSLHTSLSGTNDSTAEIQIIAARNMASPLTGATRKAEEKRPTGCGGKISMKKWTG
jgi:GTP pyrophosphokinase